MSTLVEASRPRVWTALTNPAEVVRWRPGLLAPVGEWNGYPVVGEPVRWRCRVRDLPVVLEDTPLEAATGELLRSRLRLGLFCFESTFTLAPSSRDGTQTRLGLRILAENQMPVVGGTIDRFDVRRFALDLATNHLCAARDWCEASRTEGEVQHAPPQRPDASG